MESFDPKKVRRFDIYHVESEDEEPDGHYIRASDYDLLLAEHNKLKSTLNQVDDVLVVNWITAKGGDYRKALDELVQFNIQIATDPAVNGGFELVKKGTG